MQNLILSPIDPEILIATISDRVAEKILKSANYKSNLPETKHWFSLTELCEYLPDKPKRATVYAWVSNGLIPVHKGGKKLRFLKSEIDEWLKEGKKKTTSDYAAEANKFFTKRKGGVK